MVPSLAAIVHDHTYTRKSEAAENFTANDTVECEKNEQSEDTECYDTTEEHFLAIGVQKVATVIKLCLSSKQHEDMEKVIRAQSTENCGMMQEDFGSLGQNVEE